MKLPRQKDVQREAHMIALVPLNALGAAKSRLRGALAEEDREALVIWLAGRVLDALRGSGLVERIVVLSPDARTLAVCLRKHAHEPQAHEPHAYESTMSALLTAGGDLNADLELGRRWAIARGADALLVALADLPLLTPDAIRRMLVAMHAEVAARGRAVVLAPDRAGRGTNLLLQCPADALPFAFGEGSFARHRDLARRSGLEPQLFTTEETSFDVDTPGDLREVIARDLWTPTCACEHSAAG